MNDNFSDVPLKVKTITGKDKQVIEIKFKEFEKSHFVSYYRWATDTVLLVFYWDKQK